MDILEKWLTSGGSIYSSGTTGDPKEIIQSVDKLRTGNAIACEVQGITRDSHVYTVCKLAHAGGLLTQTLPAYSVGAKITVEDFNAYRFVRDIDKYTHTHLTPDHARAIMLTKGFRTLDLSGITVTCGSDRITWDIVEAFVERGASFITNWGMTEVGPIAINKVFDNINVVYNFRALSTEGTIMGTTAHCETCIVDGELLVRGPLSVYGSDEWFSTGDRVSYQYGAYWYHGRI